MRAPGANNPPIPAQQPSVSYVSKEAAMQKVIQCPCGSVIEGQNDDEVVKKAQEHAKGTHGMDLSREQALSMARPA
jgi:predicted small metal-binding protein